MNIETGTDENLGGIADLYAAKLAWVDTIGMADGVVSGVGMLSGETFRKIGLVLDSAFYREDEEESDAGMRYLQQVGGMVKGQGLQLVNHLAATAREPLLLYAIFRSGDKKLIGNLEEPMYRNPARKDSGQRTSDKNGTRLEFSGYTIAQAPYFAGSPALDVPPSSDTYTPPVEEAYTPL